MNITVHVMLKQDIYINECRLRNALKSLKELGLSSVSLEYASQIGLIQGQAAVTSLDAIKALPVVDAVSVEETTSIPISETVFRVKTRP